MKHLKFTYIDSVTGVSVADAPAANGPKFPGVDGLEFVWARESQYPTNAPEFFGTCPADSFAMVPGVIDVLTQESFDAARVAEMAQRDANAIAALQAKRESMICTPWQIRKALNAAGLRESVEAGVDVSDQTTQDAWEFAQEFKRLDPLVVNIGLLLGKTEAELDSIFELAASL